MSAVKPPAPLREDNAGAISAANVTMHVLLE